jgi:hypothetical protein
MAKMRDHMSSPDALIEILARDLRPVRRMAPPFLRALGWLAVVFALAVVLAYFADLGAMVRRLAAAPDMWLAFTGSTLTAILATFAAFQTSLPDRKQTWALLPLPGLLLWVGASGLGCLRVWFAPETHAADLVETPDCFAFICGVSGPLSVLMLLMLRRGYPVQPNLTTAAAGLAAGAAAATLLNFFHPFDAAAADLVVHAFAVGLVVLVNRALSGRTFREMKG